MFRSSLDAFVWDLIVAGCWIRDKFRRPRRPDPEVALTEAWEAGYSEGYDDGAADVFAGTS